MVSGATTKPTLSYHTERSNKRHHTKRSMAKPQRTQPAVIKLSSRGGPESAFLLNTQIDILHRPIEECED
jgi:hypothetical protein